MHCHGTDVTVRVKMSTNQVDNVRRVQDYSFYFEYGSLDVSVEYFGLSLSKVEIVPPTPFDRYEVQKNKTSLMTGNTHVSFIYTILRNKSYKFRLSCFNIINYTF